MNICEQQPAQEGDWAGVNSWLDYQILGSSLWGPVVTSPSLKLTMLLIKLLFVWSALQKRIFAWWCLCHMNNCKHAFISILVMGLLHWYSHSESIKVTLVCGCNFKSEILIIKLASYFTRFQYVLVTRSHKLSSCLKHGRMQWLESLLS